MAFFLCTFVYFIYLRLFTSDILFLNNSVQWCHQHLPVRLCNYIGQHDYSAAPSTAKSYSFFIIAGVPYHEKNLHSNMWILWISFTLACHVPKSIPEERLEHNCKLTTTWSKMTINFLGNYMQFIDFLDNEDIHSSIGEQLLPVRLFIFVSTCWEVKQHSVPSWAKLTSFRNLVRAPSFMQVVLQLVFAWQYDVHLLIPWL